MPKSKNQLLSIYETTQDRMRTELASARAESHAPTSGKAAEDAWISYLREHLPHRYAVDTAFVIDSYGNKSEQQDIVISDRHYTPRIQDHHTLWLPAESVYAVFEVKPCVKGNIKYAGDKAASVRRLARTTKAIKHAGGEYPAVPLSPILAGILADTSGWSSSLSEKLPPLLDPLPMQSRLDLGCCADSVAVDITYEGGAAVETSDPGLGLVYFLVKLVARLQALGTVPAVDFARYMLPLESADELEG
jgi:hypothetical protein